MRRRTAQPLHVVLDGLVVLGEGRGKVMPTLPVAGRHKVQITGLLGTHHGQEGRAALLAVVRPEETGDLYFVATGDGQGGHHFSATLAEHNQAVQHYVQRLRSAAAHP